MIGKSVCLLTIILCLIAVNISMAQEDCVQRGEDDECVYQALNVGNFRPKIDGNLDDWQRVDGTFLGEDFWEDNSEQYSGEDDLSVTWWVTWDKDNLYIAISAKDDTHQNTQAGNTIWKGDGVQISIDPTGEKSTHTGVVYEYGYALSGKEPLVWRWTENAATKGENSEYAIVRDDSGELTNYEIRIPADDLAPAAFAIGETIGWGFVVNDSDTCNCQGGWIGWANLSIVHGKDATALADLVFSAETIAVSPKGALTAMWGELKK